MYTNIIIKKKTITGWHCNW